MTLSDVHPLTILAKVRPLFLHPEEFKLLSEHVAPHGIPTGSDERGRYIEWPEGARTYRSEYLPSTLPARRIYP